jgi:hypothetical protein
VVGQIHRKTAAIGDLPLVSGIETFGKRSMLRNFIIFLRWVLALVGSIALAIDIGANRAENFSPMSDASTPFIDESAPVSVRRADTTAGASMTLRAATPAPCASVALPSRRGHQLEISVKE